MEPMTMAVLAHVGSKLFTAAAKAWGAGRQRKESKAALGKFSKSYLKKSPYETEWLAMLQKRMKEGALPTREMLQDVSQRVGEHGAVARQRTMGYAASRGLEDSGVAASMVGRVDAQMLQSIAEQARAIAIQNEMTKTGAEGEFGQYARGESDLIRQLAAMKYGAGEDIRSRFYGGMTGAAEDVGEGVSGFAEMQMGQQPQYFQGKDGTIWEYNPKTGKWKEGG